MEQMISMSQVDLAFNGKPALSKLSFDVEKSEIFGFLGPSGAGKTTTIKLLTKQLIPDTGNVRIFGQNISKLPQKAFDNIGILTDNSGIYERLSVYENLSIFAEFKKIPAETVYQTLEQVGLHGEEKKPAKKLSKGMKQRLILARAILHQPDLLFLDEPTAALDPGTSKDIHHLLKKMNRNGTTIFLTTHNMEEADKLCSRVAFLDHGSVVECDSPATLKIKYGKNTITLLTKSGKTLTVEKNPAGLAKLAEQCTDENILTIHSLEPTSEDIFLHLTGRSLS